MDVDAHLAKFDNGATKIMRKIQFDQYGLSQIDGTAFILPKSEADALIAFSNGDKRLLEQELGLSSGLLEQEELIRVDVSNPKKYNIRIPSGNEAGTNNLWIPGGQLPNGYSEAVIDARQISLEDVNIIKLN